MHAHNYGGTRGVAVDRSNDIAVTYGPGSPNNKCSVLFTYNRQESSDLSPHPLRKDYSSTPLTIYGHSQTDYIRATLGADTIYAMGGNDQVAGKDGADVIDLGGFIDGLLTAKVVTFLTLGVIKPYAKI